MKWWERTIILAGVSIFLLMGIYIGVDTWQFRNNSEPGTAEIISIRAESKRGSGSDGRSSDYVSYYPTVRFATRQGVQYEMEMTQAVQPPIPEIGDRIAVLYWIAGNRGQLRLDYAAWRDWIVAGSVTGVSLLFFVCALVLTKRDVPNI